MLAVAATYAVGRLLRAFHVYVPLVHARLVGQRDRDAVGRGLEELAQLLSDPARKG